MKHKYTLNSGLAFSESKDLKKLSAKAKEGWLLCGFAFGGLFYKLEAGSPTNIDYNIDYREKPDKEYFQMFKACGWDNVISSSNVIHIFKAPTGTTPIYSDHETEIEKYKSAKRMFEKAIIVTLIAIIVFIILNILSQKNMTVEDISPLFTILKIGLALSIIGFVFSFMPYIGFSNHLKKIMKLEDKI